MAHRLQDRLRGHHEERDMKTTRNGLIAAALALVVVGCDGSSSSGAVDTALTDTAQDAAGDAGTDDAAGADADTAAPPDATPDTASPDADATPPDPDVAPADADASPPDATPDTDVTEPPDAGVGSEPDFSWPDNQLTLELAYWGLYLQGALFSGPRASFHTEQDRQGQCRLLTFTFVPCEPGCEWPEMCAGGQCIAQPPLLSAGTLQLTGFPGGPIAIEPTSDGAYWYQTEAVKSDGTETVTLTAPGADASGFSLQAKAVEAPEPEGDWSALLAARAPGEDVTLTWTDPTADARVYIRMTTGIGTHGGISPVEIECEGPDTGSLLLPGAYLDALYAEGWSCGECGDNTLWRYRADVTATEPHVQLRVQSRASFYHHPNF
jgi:hypothetical protein